MTFSKELMSYYRELCSVENHYSWKNTGISMPMSTLQEFIDEIDRLTRQLADARACNEALVEQNEQLRERRDHGQAAPVQ